jgi:hypothetical protein
MKQLRQKLELEKDKKQDPAPTIPAQEKGKQPELPQPHPQHKRFPKYRHVVVLVHLNRGYSAASFAFDYERNWFAAFLDDIKVNCSPFFSCTNLYCSPTRCSLDISLKPPSCLVELKWSFCKKFSLNMPFVIVSAVAWLG